MNEELIKAHLNLHAVLQNLEDLVKLDAESAALVKNWDLTVQFSVWDGPSAYVQFYGGECKHGMGRHPDPAFKLGFFSLAHLNAMFEEKRDPIPFNPGAYLKLKFLKNEFPVLFARLKHYVKPSETDLADEDFVKVNTTLTLNTAVHAVKVLADLEPVSRKVAGHMPAGIAQVEVLPDGPSVNIGFAKEVITVNKGQAAHPAAKMSFKNMAVANQLLSGKLDGFLAIGKGDVMVRGHIPMIDGLSLILDRVPLYLS